MANIIKIFYLKWRFRLKYHFSPRLKQEYVRFLDKKKCFVLLAADYGNLGDVAITFAQEKFLAEHFSDYEVIDIPISKTLTDLKSLKNICTDNDIVTVVGGGNMSDMYFDIELLRQLVVKVFSHNRVILFPQTMFYSDTPGGRYLKRLSTKIYSRHKNITITARERWSYESMKLILPNCKLLPDIVMTLNKREPKSERKGITLCLRNDAESDLSKEFKDNIQVQVSSEYNVVNYDTHIGRGNLSLDERQYELNKIWKQFRSSEWVITDRLHGMIFAFITGTPCIVLPNNNFKIEGCFTWIKECGYIYFMDEMIVNQLTHFLKRKKINYNFDAVFNDINNRIESIL